MSPHFAFRSKSRGWIEKESESPMNGNALSTGDEPVFPVARAGRQASLRGKPESPARGGAPRRSPALTNGEQPQTLAGPLGFPERCRVKHYQLKRIANREYSRRGRAKAGGSCAQSPNRQILSLWRAAVARGECARAGVAPRRQARGWTARYHGVVPHREALLGRLLVRRSMIFQPGHGAYFIRKLLSVEPDFAI